MWTKQISLGVFATLGLFVAAAFADSGPVYQPIRGEDLRAVFLETEMVGEYRQFREKTKTSNYTEYHFKDGNTDYREGALSEKGIWYILADEKICYKYPQSVYYPSIYCFFVYKNDKCYYKYSLHNMRIVGLNAYRPYSWDAWSSRAIRKGTHGTCNTPVS